MIDIKVITEDTMMTIADVGTLVLRASGSGGKELLEGAEGDEKSTVVLGTAAGPKSKRQKKSRWPINAFF